MLKCIWIHVIFSIVYARKSKKGNDMSEKVSRIKYPESPQKSLQTRSGVERASEDSIIDFKEAVESTLEPVNPFEPGWQDVHERNQQILRDTQNYLDQRSYIDKNGASRTADGKFARPDGTSGKTDTDLYDASRVTEKRYEDLTMSELADDIAWSELFNDKTRVGDLQDVLVDKMITFAEANNMDNEAQDNLQDRMLRLIESKKKKHMSNPEWLKQNGWTKSSDDVVDVGIEANNDEKKAEKAEAVSHETEKSDEMASSLAPQGEVKGEERELNPEKLKEELVDIILAQEAAKRDHDEKLRRIATKIKLIELELGIYQKQQDRELQKRASRFSNAYKRIRNWRSIIGGRSEEDLKRLDSQVSPKAVAEDGRASTASKQASAVDTYRGGKKQMITPSVANASVEADLRRRKEEDDEDEIEGETLTYKTYPKKKNRT